MPKQGRTVATMPADTADLGSTAFSAFELDAFPEAVRWDHATVRNRDLKIFISNGPLLRRRPHA